MPIAVVMFLAPVPMVVIMPRFCVLFARIVAAYLTLFPATLAAMIVATLFVMLCTPASLGTFFTTFPATTKRPGDHLNLSDRLHGIVADDEQIAGMRIPLRRFVTDHDVEARAAMKGGRERIMDEMPMAVLVLEGYLGDVQIAVAHVAD
jgi:hypothetical protein